MDDNGSMAVDGGRGKRKQQPGDDDEPGSPATGVLTMAGMQALLAAHLGTQTKELQAHQTAEIGKAVRAMEERTNKQIEHVRREIQKEMRDGHNENAGAIDKLQQGQQQMEKRLAALENREPSTAASTDAGESRRQAIILGGWPRDTPRLDILSDVKAMALDLDILAQLGDYFVPGQRNSICICPFEGGGGYTDRGKMLAVVGKIQSARLQTEHLAEGKSVWATLSRPKAERERASHSSKMRRLLYTLGWDAHQSDPEYSSGTLWAKEKLLGSAARAKPEGVHCEQGRAANSWINIDAFSDLTGKTKDEVVQAWQECWAN